VSNEQRRAALRCAYAALVPGGILIMRNPNRLHPVDPFSGMLLVSLFPPRLALALGRLRRPQRSYVRLRTPLGARFELRHAGFRDIRVMASPGRRTRRTFAGYHQVTARRPME
jgi:hypothetical protein